MEESIVHERSPEREELHFGGGCWVIDAHFCCSIGHNSDLPNRYCWGGGMLTRLGGKDNLFSSLVIAHPAPPSLKDIEAIKVGSKALVKHSMTLTFCVKGTYFLDCC